MKNWRSYLTQLTDEKIKEYTEKGYWPNKRLCEYLDDAAALFPDKIAIVDRFGRYTYKQFKDWVDNTALGLLHLGIEKGDVISFQLPNWKEVLILTYACTRIGAVFNAIAPIFRERDMGVMLKLAKPRIMVVPDVFRDFNHAEMIKSLWPQVPGLEKVFVVGKEIPGGMESFEKFLNTPWEEKVGKDELKKIEVDPNSVTQLAFTSGTTGEPKGVLHTHNTVLDTIQTWKEIYGLNENDIIHMASTLGHQTGFLYGTELPIVIKGTGVYQDVWNAVEFVELVERERITMSNGAIPFLSDFLRAPNFDKHDLSSLRLFGCFGAGLPRPLARLAHEKLPGVFIFGGWGMTETSLCVLNRPTDPIDLICETDGRPCRGTEIKIMSNDFQRELPPGEEGELVTRGPMLTLGFLQPELAKDLFLEGGWYITGDRGYIREDGNFVMTSRSKDIIVRGGENIPVLEVENLLLEHPSIQSVAVVAVPDERLGERACACIITYPGKAFTFEDMIAWLKEKKLTRQFWPEILEVFSEFPTTASGKIQKYRLREIIKEKYDKSKIY